MSPVRRALGFSWPALVALAALAAPRVVLHDLGVVEEGTVVNALLVFVPPACWVAVVSWRRPPRPFLTVLVIGLLHGVFLAVGHQLLWDTAFDGTAPTLGGALAGVGPDGQELLLRAAAVGSGVITGAAVGAVAGGVAHVLTRPVDPGAARPTEGGP
jgi:hypothetical protein